ncbi:MAG TPA: M13 family metallopeptidase [Bacteroidia bacterium]|jgi:putative endopeptidase|nr:M13 family metallopeptidase [Bacteroidia bacterium]
MKLKITTILVCALGLNLAAQTIGINLSYIDSSFTPQNDFYKYCNGKWLKTTKIPDSDSRWGSFNEINERNLSNLKTILKTVSETKTVVPGSDFQKLHDFYLTAMDSVKAEKLGITPIKPDLAKIDALKTSDDLIKLLADFRKKGIGNFIGFDVDIDLKNSNRNLVYFLQTGYSLPDRDYYYLPQFESIRTAYQEHLKKMFEILKFHPEAAEANAKKVYEIEKALALKAMNAAAQRDVQKQYNPYSKTDLLKSFPNINWTLYFTTLGVKMPDTMIVAHVDFYTELNTLVKTYSLNDWKTFLKWKVIHESAAYLSSDAVNENFNFYSKTLSGAKQMKPRWKRAQGEVNKSVGEILGKVYVEQFFNNDAKEKVKRMVENLIAAYRERITTRQWMSEPTKKQANLKLDKLIKKFGFPDTWKDYKLLTIKTDNYWQNVIRSSEFEYKRKIAKLPKPVDKMEWGMTPPTVNAYYNPTTNEIAFPAGIMQVPFFDYNADDAYNYGIMGSIIGHELTHGFDDQGSQFDSEGNLKMWWTPEDNKNFMEKKKPIITQFNSFIAIDTLRVNGELTQGENIADLGGLTMAYYAYKKSLGGQKSPVMSGFTGEQRFFIAWAQGWKILAREAAEKQQLATDPHAPGKFRGFAPLTNMPEFYEAFKIKDVDPMYRKPETRVEIW